MVGNWSSGMIPASGAGGREFDSRIAPVFFVRLLFGRFPFFINRRAPGWGVGNGKQYKARYTTGNISYMPC
jgi:hypothetical protein